MLMASLIENFGKESLVEYFNQIWQNGALPPLAQVATFLIMWTDEDFSTCLPSVNDEDEGKGTSEGIDFDRLETLFEINSVKTAVQDLSKRHGLQERNLYRTLLRINDLNNANLVPEHDGSYTIKLGIGYRMVLEKNAAGKWKVLKAGTAEKYGGTRGRKRRVTR